MQFKQERSSSNFWIKSLFLHKKTENQTRKFGKKDKTIFRITIDKFCKLDYNEVQLEGMEMELTKSELEIMDVLWNENIPMSRADLLARDEEKSWRDSSVHILLNGLLQKGVIREAGFVRRSKTYGRTFVPTLTREQYYIAHAFGHRNQPDVVELFTALLERPEVDAAVLAKLQTVIDGRREKP